jgi:SAM-dependent methyltransferase
MKQNSIVENFWRDAYSTLYDGGYISNDIEINNYRFQVEENALKNYIKEYVPENQRGRALDIGCGNGRFTEVMAEYFDAVDAIDISSTIIEKNILKNKYKNINYYNNDLEQFAQKVFLTYDFIYVGGVLMYIFDDKVEDSYRLLDKLLHANGKLILRESVMTKKRVDNISDSYIAYYRVKDFYAKGDFLKFLTMKENLAYRVGELRQVLVRLKMGFLFQPNLYKKLLVCLKCKDLFWKPKLNKLVNYYYFYIKKYK